MVFHPNIPHRSVGFLADDKPEVSLAGVNGITVLLQASKFDATLFQAALSGETQKTKVASACPSDFHNLSAVPASRQAW
jgi:hypothetical protein